MLYHPNSEFARPVEQYATDFERVHRQKIELLSLETKEGAELARLYDIVRYPAVLARTDEGVLLKQWQQDSLPLMNEVAGYIHQ
ncbi:hypothetical protein BH23PAT2_BH23PAT2_03440 [soil metagenome]